jgi:RNA-directed DNA polymerase
MEGYFDSIPHDKLMACVRMQVLDGSVLRLVKQWLDAPVEKRDGNGKIQRRHNKQGTPQGGVILPLVANIYLHWFEHVFHAKNGPAQWAKAVLVRYADDFVIRACYVGPALQRFVDEKIKGWLAENQPGEDADHKPSPGRASPGLPWVQLPTRPLAL